VRLGDIVPADACLFEGDPVEVDQSVLTGESLPVTRKENETIYSGSIIRQGKIDAPVQAVYVGRRIEHWIPFFRSPFHREPEMRIGAK
jgi:P-type E1-E2 ATPase